MSLLKWKEIAKRKSELGNKMNYVHDTITKQKPGEKTSQESLAKVFKPVTTKLDDVIVSNLRRPRTQFKRGKKGDIITEIDYAPDVDSYEDMDIEGLFDFGVYVPPQQDKQPVTKPLSYEEFFKDISEGKKPDDPPEYEDDEDIDYALNEEDMA